MSAGRTSCRTGLVLLPRYFAETALRLCDGQHSRSVSNGLRASQERIRGRLEYIDQALAPAANEVESLELVQDQIQSGISRSARHIAEAQKHKAAAQ